MAHYPLWMRERDKRAQARDVLKRRLLAGEKVEKKVHPSTLKRSVHPPSLLHPIVLFRHDFHGNQPVLSPAERFQIVLFLHCFAQTRACTRGAASANLGARHAAARPRN